MFCFHIAEPNEALLISGRKGKEQVEGAAESMRFKIVTGGRAFVWPVLQSVKALKLDLRKAEVPVPCHTTQGIPVEIKGVIAFKVGADFPSIANAAQRFLADPNSMEARVHDLFAGHVRAIVGGLTVEQLIRERESLTTAARDQTGHDMEKMGLVIDSLQIAGIGDPTGYIENLAKPQLARVNRDARIAEAETGREAAEKEAQQGAMIAEAQRQSEILQAEAQAQVDRTKAEAAQAGPMAEADAKRAVVQMETEVAQLEAAKRERQLETEIKRPADAEAYAMAKTAEGERDAKILAAEAEAAQTKQVGAAQAEAKRAQGLAEAEIIEKKGVAEGMALHERAVGLAENQDAVINQQIAEQLPEVVAAAASAWNNVDNMTVFNGADGLQQALNSILAAAGQSIQSARSTFATTHEPESRKQAAPSEERELVSG